MSLCLYNLYAEYIIRNAGLDENSETEFYIGLCTDREITVDGDCSHKTKSCLLLGRKAMTNLDSILKSTDITLLTKVHIDKTTVFPCTVVKVGP